MSAAPPSIGFRLPRQEDAAKIFAWRNLPEMVSRTSERRPVGWDEHNAWFHRVMTDPDHLLFIVVQKDEDIGVVRFDRASWKEAVISVYLLPGHTGRGLGVEAIELGCARAFEAWDIDRIYANILADNQPAISAFTRAKFASVLDPGYLLPGHVTRVRSRP